MNGQRRKEAIQAKTRIVIADSHEVVRRGICQEIAQQPDMEVVGITADGYEALALVRRLRPDVVVLDVKLANLDGVEVTRALQEITWQSAQKHGQSTAVLVFSAYSDKQYIWSLLAVGVKGYLLKSEPLEQLIRGIRCVAAKQTVLSQSIQNSIIEMIPKLNQDLSATEAKVMQLLARGMSNQEIAAQLHITEGTVKAHLSNTYRKIPWIRTRAEAIAWAWINRIVSD